MNRKNRSLLFARVLIFIAISLFFVGTVLEIRLNSKVIDPIADVIPMESDNSEISITSVDDEVIPEVIKEEPEYIGISDDISDVSTASNKNIVETVDYTELINSNNEYRLKIQNDYDVLIRYGIETEGYVVGGLSTEIIDDEQMVKNQLDSLNEVLSLYPDGFFQEMKNGGIPLTIYLIKQYSDRTVTGVTDSSYSFANISIAAIYPFNESFFHESYHYIERYMFKNGANFNSWNSLNPDNFDYINSVIDAGLAYDRTFSKDAPFVNSYAQTSPEEDRASTFEYMMAPNKASCFYVNSYIFKKAQYMSLMIESVFKSVNTSTVEYWERFV